MRIARFYAVAMLLLLSPAAAEEKSSAVRTMMEASGMVEEFADLGEEWRSQVLQSAQAGGGVPLEFADGFGAIVAETMNGRRMVTDLEAALTETVSVDDARAMTAFYATPLGQRLRKAEVGSSNQDAQSYIDEHGAELRAQLDADPERRAIFVRMDSALLGSELSATMISSMMRAMIVGVLVSQNQEPAPETVAMIEQQTIGSHAALVEAMHDIFLASSQLTYRDFSNEEMDTYLDFLQSAAGRAVYAGFDEAMNGIFAARGSEIGEKFGAYVRQKRI